jgi:hypothetical protein
MAGPKYQPPLENAADTETEETAGHEHRGEWQRAVHDSQRDPAHESLQRARERVYGDRADDAAGRQTGGSQDAGDDEDNDEGEVTRDLRNGTGERPGEVECAQFAPPEDADE